MKTLIIGSIALDDVKTPYGEVKKALGGSAVYSSLAASYFTQAGIVGVVGKDFPKKNEQLLLKHNIKLTGLTREPGYTFHWQGYYEGDMSSAHTLNTQLNVFGKFNPTIPNEFTNTPWVFLANISPELQKQVLKQLKKPRLVLLDTMNYWITNKKAELLSVIKDVDILIINQEEAQALTGELNLIQAANLIKRQGPQGVIIKKGEHGALVFWQEKIGIIPGFPLGRVKDPTGAGDTFAGGFIGVMAQQARINFNNIYQAAFIGTIMAYFTIEDFSVKSLVKLKLPEFKLRCKKLRAMVKSSDFIPEIIQK